MIQLEEMEKLNKTNICRAISLGFYNYLRSLNISKEDVLNSIKQGVKEAMEKTHK